MPYFSIVIPTYNRSAMLRRALHSVLAQSEQDFEVIVVDDGSTDDTREVFSSEFSHNSKVSIISGENRERGAARNAGLRAASGLYVCFLDSDDVFLPHHLATLKKHIEKENPDYITTRYMFSRDGRLKASDSCRLTGGYYDYRLFLNGNPIACNICIRKDNPGLRLFEEDRRFAIKEDWMFMIENLRNNRMLLIDEVTIHMHDHDERSMRTNSNLIIQRTRAAYDWILSHVSLSKKETKVLSSHVDYFCAIHSYIANDRSSVISFLLKAARNGLKKKHIILFIKSMAGFDFIQKVKRGLG